MMEQIKLINFVDAESHQAGVAILRAGLGEVGITLSLEEDGDTEAFLTLHDSQLLLEALQQAIAAAQGAVLAA